MKKIIAMILGGTLLVGCGSWRNPIERISPHRIPIQQGNAVTQEMLDKLKPGMTQNQVRFVLGTPLLVEPFREDRWDYVYHKTVGDKVVEQRRITVLFQDGVLKGIEGDVRPPAPKEGAISLEVFK